MTTHQQNPELAMLRAAETFWRTLRDASGPLVRGADCSRAAAALIRMLATRTREGNPTQVGDVAHLMRVDTSVASRQVSQLVDDGLVERLVDTDDRRARTLHLTPAGVARAQEIETRLAQRTAELFADWDAHDLATATEVLVRLSATFDRASVHERAPA
ncbi:MarR family winged helix-turn-helix transcriptional regulator [Cellulomonas palmilytica]|uniref:MarR family winged helix-turn-helix transcriptional regulator n=1 Tax=Cellulomonas palmilytica TaxID=2608402 RepID=UPI001F17AEF8|nr:MarR family transcriptional regulator [Cellulomonas palmilytica]UJP39973.1 MarR family transcriptional regulator [Cellulomonas palmilytica]